MSHVQSEVDPAARVRRWALIILAVTAIAVIAWTWRSIAVLQREANAAVDPLGQISADPDQLDETELLLRNSAIHAQRAKKASNALPLRVASRLPLIGDDMRAARTLANALDNTVSDAGVPMVDLAARLLDVPEQGNGPRPLVNTDALNDAPATVDRASRAISVSHQELAEINAASIIDQLSVPVTLATDKLGKADQALREANAYAPFAADLLGADKPRDYLLVFENLAEARPTGGIAGKWALVRVDKGAIQLVDIGANENLTELTLTSRPPLEDDFVALYGPSLGPVTNANLTPNFPDAARLILATWAQQGRQPPQGVVSVDTVAIARLLELTGPITVPTPGSSDQIVVGADNFVQVAQADMYRWFEGQEEARQLFLSGLTAVMLDRLGDNMSMRNLATTLAGLRDGQHLMAYSQDEAEERALQQAGLSGALPAPTGKQALVFVTDNGGSKLQHYLHLGTCATAQAIGVQIRNDVPADFSSALPDYVLNQRAGAPDGDQIVTLACG